MQSSFAWDLVAIIAFMPIAPTCMRNVRLDEREKNENQITAEHVVMPILPIFGTLSHGHGDTRNGNLLNKFVKNVNFLRFICIFSRIRVTYVLDHLEFMNITIVCRCLCRFVPLTPKQFNVSWLDVVAVAPNNKLDHGHWSKHSHWECLCFTGDKWCPIVFWTKYESGIGEINRNTFDLSESGDCRSRCENWFPCNEQQCFMHSFTSSAQHAIV